MTGHTLGLGSAAAAGLPPADLQWAHLPLAQWMMHDGWTGWGWPFGGFFWLLFVGLAIYGLIQLLRSRESIGPKDDASGSTALKTLDERYAKSEIDREEYLRRKRDILGKGET